MWDGYLKISILFLYDSKHDYCECYGNIRSTFCAWLRGPQYCKASFMQSMHYRCLAAHRIQTMLQSLSFIGSTYDINYSTFILDTKMLIHSVFDFPIIYYFTTTYGLYTFYLVNFRKLLPFLNLNIIY